MTARLDGWASRRLVLAGSAAFAASLLLASLALPFWSMRLEAPQYPQGLVLRAWGDRVEGDLHEINIINHYIGMGAITARPAPEMALFRPALLVLAFLALAAPLHRLLGRLAIAAAGIAPIVILADLQVWLHRFGHDLDPTAPLRAAPFTPHAVGVSKIGQFTTSAWPGPGFWSMAAAAAVLALGAAIARRVGDAPAGERPAALRSPTVPVTLVLVLALAAPALGSANLQQRLDAAPPGSTVTVVGGLHAGPLTIRGPLTVVGVGGPVVDGGGRGSVVTLIGEGVVFRGFTVRGSGRQVTEEAAGIAVRGSGHRVEANRIEDVYFGIHVADASRIVILDNDLAPGTRRGARPGHAISLWYTRDARVVRNRIRDARDGVYLSFAERAVVEGNDVSSCRYGIHSMYSSDSVIRDNHLHDNLLGAALMYSQSLTLAGNRIERHRAGATPYGLLLKDIGDLDVSGNRFVGNRVGIYAEGVGQEPGSTARIRGNLLAGHEAALVLQRNATIVASGNSLLDNLTDVRAGGGRLADDNRWSENGRGNRWSTYQGYDRDGDGVGDLPHRVEGLLQGLLGREPSTQAFLYTPAHQALEAAARMFPLFRAEPLLVDEAPLVGPVATEARR